MLCERGVHPALPVRKGHGLDLSLPPTTSAPPAPPRRTPQGVEPSSLRLLPAASSPAAAELNALVDTIRAARPAGWMTLHVLKQGLNDAPFLRGLVEDQTKQMMSYPEFLLHCHRYVLSKA